LFPNPPHPDEIQNCNEAGVLGVLPGIIGVMQAAEVIKLLTKIGEVLLNKLLTYNLLNHEIFILEITGGNAYNLIPKTEIAFKAMDYDWLCGISVTETEALSLADFVRKSTILDTIVIDVREKDELPKADFRCINIPLSELSTKMDTINEKNILLFCQSGKRSLKAAAILTEKFGTTKTIRHLKDGIMALQDKYNEQDN
jgi:rhodanese-related sulfurtransferase